MTDKEFKRLSRSQLIDVIYQLQLKQKELTEENQRLKDQLEDKRLRMRQAGSIADAAVVVNGVFQAAQNAADQYLEEIRRMREETEVACRRILEDAHKQAKAMGGPPRVSDTDVDTILRDYRKETKRSRG